VIFDLADVDPTTGGIVHHGIQISLLESQHKVGKVDAARTTNKVQSGWFKQIDTC
jgi:hypothetical protein